MVTGCKVCSVPPAHTWLRTYHAGLGRLGLEASTTLIHSPPPPSSSYAAGWYLLLHTHILEDNNNNNSGVVES